MATPEVGSGKVSIFPVMTGFRRAVSAEVDGTTKTASSRFTSGFQAAGTSAGKGFASGFKASTSGLSSEALRRATDEVAKASREVSTARLRELDLAGRVRVAETALTDARGRYVTGSVQVVRAEERLATAQRALAATSGTTAAATDRLAAAKLSLANASNQAATAGSRVQGTFARLPGTFDSVGASSGTRFRNGFLDVLGGALGANLITGIGFTIGRGINQGIGAAFALGFGGVELSSNLEQSLGAIDSVFKAHSETIKGFASDAAQDVGLSQASYLKFATVVGAQLKNLKIPFGQVAGQTDELISLGADLAAQFGGSTSDAVSALSSLLRGERDPIERYGVSIKQSDINARLAAQGLRELTGDALRQAEIQATLAILWEQTADAQGTFFKESDTYAHKQQVLNAQLEEAQTKLGTFLLPAFTSITEYANDSLLPRLDSVIDRVGPKLAAALETSAPATARLLDKVTPLVEKFILWGGEEGIPAVIAGLDDMADAAPGWASAFKVLTDEDNPLSKLSEWLDFSDQTEHGRAVRTGIADFFEGIAEDTRDFLEGPGSLEGPGADWAMGFGDGVHSSTSDVLGSVSDLGQGASDELDPFAFESFGAGKNFGDALAKGIASKQIKVGLAGFSIGAEAAKQAKAGLKIASPSAEGLGIGSNFGGSIATGMEGEVPAVRSAAEDLAAAALFNVRLGDFSAGTGSAGGSALAPVMYEGRLYLDSGEFMGVVRGELQAQDVRTDAAIAGGVVR